MSNSKKAVKQTLPVTLATIEEQERQLIAQLEANRAKKADLKTAEIKVVTDKVNGLCVMFGVATLAEVIALIKHVEKGTLGVESGPGRTYKQLNEEETAKLVERLKAGGPANQVSILATDFGISEQTVWRKKKEAGLTASAPATV